MPSDTPEVLWGARAYIPVIKEETGQTVDERHVYYGVSVRIYPGRKHGQAVATTRTELIARLRGTDGYAPSIGPSSASNS
jgi:hypothetical protein